ncbi:MAG TPA: substrate-binding domain-containing protein [Acidobacteriaceae bacterium]|nr:substrate-binding domain-containing protein [Acidobacteriaceae bacterium]
MKKLIPAVLCAATCMTAANAQNVIRVWGHGNPNRDDMGGLVRAWEDEFREANPEYRNVQFENSLKGNASAIGGLYTGAAELALIDRPPLAIEVDAYQQGAGHDPTGVAVATGSLATQHHAPALAIVVNAKNPVGSLTLKQIDAAFGADHRRGSTRAYVWGDLADKDGWTARPIHLYGFGINRVQSFLFEKAMMKGSQKWREGLQEVADGNEDAPARIVKAVAADADGIGITTMDGVGSTAGVRVVPIDDGIGNAVVPTEQSLANGNYPLQRTLYAYFNLPSGTEMQPALRAFLMFVLSKRGQALARANGYLPLPATAAHEGEKVLQR